MPFAPKNTKVTDLIVGKLGVRRSTARVYASTLAMVAREVKLKDGIEDLTWLRKKKVLKFVSNINNLTRRKNTASGIIAGLKTIGDKKTIEQYRDILMQADKDYTAFLTSGKRKRKYKDADAAWTQIKGLWRKVSPIIRAQKIWQLGESINPSAYRQLMTLIYFKFLSDMPVRRLEYAETRFIDEADFKEDGGNYIIVRPKKPWTWSLGNYKTSKTFGRQEFLVSMGLKQYLKKLRPITQSKNKDEYIFMNSRWKKMSRDLFGKFVVSNFNTYLGKRFSQNTVRSIKVSSVWKDSVKTLDALRLAESMAHDPRTAMVHYR